MYSWTQARFLKILDRDQVDLLEQTTQVISQFEPILQEKIRTIFAEGFNLQMKITIGFAAAQFLSIAIMWEKKLLRVGKT